MRVLKFDGLAIDGVDLVNGVAEMVDAAEKGWAVARPVLVEGANRGFWLAVDGVDLLVNLSQVVIESGRQHRIRYGAQYAAVLLTVLVLLAMVVRAQLGREGAYEELCEAVTATRELVKGWVLSWLVRSYEVWLAMVSREVIEILGYAPDWVRKALVGE